RPKDTKTNSRPRLYARATIAPEGESCRRQVSTALISTGKRLAKARHWSGSTSTAETCALGSHARRLAWFLRLQTAPDLGSLHEDSASHHRRPARPVRRRTQRLRIRGCHQSNQ